jgi:predicted PurR-regulated permease PerM
MWTKMKGSNRNITAFLKAYFKGQLILCCLLAVLYSLGFGLVGLPWGYVVGAFTGLMSWVPILGSMLGLFVAMIIIIFNFSSALLLKICLVYFVIQLLEGFVLAPHIVGRTVGLSFWQSLVAILIGAIFFGPLGATIAIPVAALVKYLLEEQKSEEKNT